MPVIASRPRHCERSEAIQGGWGAFLTGLLRRFAPRNDGIFHSPAAHVPLLNGRTVVGDRGFGLSAVCYGKGNLSSLRR
ncbi:MAG: hypothetical protein LBT00_14630 [Spirochaetaceae bacterium]|nr:hypothetical protein [Spirochaetaceae bacterium]